MHIRNGTQYLLVRSFLYTDGPVYFENGKMLRKKLIEGATCVSAVCYTPWNKLLLFVLAFRYVDLKACITRLPDDGAGSNVTTGPARLHNPPDRLQSIQMDAYISRRELFRAESKYWSEIIGSYVRVLRWKSYKLRNVLDMRAGFGGYAFYLQLVLFPRYITVFINTPLMGCHTLLFLEF